MPSHLLDLNAGVPNRGVEALRGRLERYGEVRVYAVRDAGELPEPGAPGPWVLSGGPGSPWEEGPWRAPLLAALRARVAARLPTLAICYGFELLGAAMGAELRRLTTPRLGVWPVALTAAGRADPLTAGVAAAGSFENREWGVFGAFGTTLARGTEGDVVAVRLAPGVVGAIFHPEADDAAVAEVLAEGGAVAREVDSRYGSGTAARMRHLGVSRVNEGFLAACLAELG